MKICVLCNGYPTTKTSESVFVAKLFDEIADQGHEVSIVAPQSLTRIWIRNGALSPSYFEHSTGRGNVVRVYRPKIVSFGKLLPSRINGFLRHRAIKNVVSKIKDQDVYYGHFWGNAYELYRVIRHLNKPLFVATGESIISFRTNDENFKKYLSGVISVSSKNVDESIDANLTTKDKCIVLPNAIDTDEFYKMDKSSCRKDLGINEKDFVVIYVGNFSKRKGSSRLAQAIDQCHDEQLKVIFLGRAMGGSIPTCKGIIKAGFAEHKDVVKYMNAADAYVLPTLAEGCCNSIVEAMACGLPIISSNLPFNYDILDSTNSILVDPNDVNQLAAAILRLKNNPDLRNRMSEKSLIKAKDLRLPSRAEKIINYIKGQIK